MSARTVQYRITASEFSAISRKATPVFLSFPAFFSEGVATTLRKKISPVEQQSSIAGLPHKASELRAYATGGN
jgi:hypothetical protein